MKIRILLLSVFFAFSFVSTAQAASFGVLMTGGQEAPGPGDQDGLGFADFVLKGTTLEYSIAVFNIEPPTAMHIHAGERGVPGGVVVGFPAFTGNVNVGMMEIPQSLATALEQNPTAFYLNVHTASFSNGAVRGQVQWAWYLPVVGRTPGAGETNFLTQLSAVNLSSNRSSTGTMEFFPQSASGTATRALIQLPTIGPLAQLVDDDVLPDQLGTGIGALKILMDEPFDITAQIRNDLRGIGEGTTGFSTKALPLEDAGTVGTMPGLSSTTDVQITNGERFRTNVGYFNPQLFPVTVSLQARANDGALIAEEVFTVAPKAMEQRPAFALITGVADRDIPSFWISWVSSSPMFVYASVVDNLTGDSILVD
ncbi:MAG: CHRD domain-containing protein [Thermoanaerobaculia bacterium]